MEDYIEKIMEQLNSGESKTIFKKHFLYIVIIGLTTSGRKAWQDEEETRKDTSVVLIHKEQSCILRALQSHSGLSLIDPTLQDNVVIPRQLLPVHLSCRMCNQFTFHHHSGLILGGQNFEQHTDSILSACGSYGQDTTRILIGST